MIINEASGVFLTGSLITKSALSLAGLLFTFLLLYIIIFPWLDKRKKKASIQMHADINRIKELVIPQFNRIAIALDFSENDEKLLAFALGQGRQQTQYVLVHIVESASAKLLGKESDDYETRKDQERMDFYVDYLKTLGHTAEGYLGFRNRSKEIVRIVKDIKADMLVAGAHGHTGLKDFIYGETVNTVRHELKIPVLIVNV
jgi:manganese transport protein